MFGLVTFTGLLALLAYGTWRRPAVAFAAVLCLFGLKQWGQNTSAFLTDHRTIANIAIGVMVVVGLLRARVNGRRHDWVLSPPGQLALGLYCYAAMTLTWTPALDQALAQWAPNWPYILTFGIVSPLLFASADDVKSASQWTVMIGGTVCLLALFFGTWGNRGLLITGDLYGMETNPLALAGLGGSVLIMASIALPSAASYWRKGLYLAFTVAGMAVILKSGSRGQLIAAAAAALIGWHLVSRRRNFGTLILVVVAGAVLAGLGWWIWDTIGVESARWTGEQSTEDVLGRINSALLILSAAASNPATLLFGIGNCGSFFYIGGYPHVAALEILAEEGLVGAALYVAIIVASIKSIRELQGVARNEASGSMRQVVAMLTALFLFEWILTLKQGTLLSSIYFFAYAAVLGRVAAWTRATVQVHHAPIPERTQAAGFANLMS